MECRDMLGHSQSLWFVANMLDGQTGPVTTIIEINAMHDVN
jgi:hypothetical protein